MVKNLPSNAGGIRDVGSIPGSGRSPGGGNGSPLQYWRNSSLENPMDRGAWWVTVCGLAKSRTWLKWLSMHIRKLINSFSGVPGLWWKLGKYYCCSYLTNNTKNPPPPSPFSKNCTMNFDLFSVVILSHDIGQCQGTKFPVSHKITKTSYQHIYNHNALIKQFCFSFSV